jgi:hypothetical protein
MHTCFHASIVPSPFDAAFVLARAILVGLWSLVLERCTATAYRQVDDYRACVEYMTPYDAVFCIDPIVIHCTPILH